MKFVARSACNEGFVSILTLYHRRTSPEISNRPREFAWELWERHDKHQTQEYPMYALAYCAGKPVGSSVLGVEVERKEKSGTNYRGWREVDPLVRGGSSSVHATSPRLIVLAIVHSLALHLTHTPQ